MASKLVGTISFAPSLLPWLPLRHPLIGKGAWVSGLGCSGHSQLGDSPWLRGLRGAEWGVTIMGDTSASDPYAAMLLGGAGTCPRQERPWASHHEETGQVRARDPFFLEAEDQEVLWMGRPIQSAPRLEVGCGGPLRVALHL